MNQDEFEAKIKELEANGILKKNINRMKVANPKTMPPMTTWNR